MSEIGMESGRAREGVKSGRRALELSLPYPRVSGNGKTRLGPSGVFSVKAARDYDLDVKKALVNSVWSGDAIRAQIEVHFDAWPPDARERDSDNVEKVLKDALTKAGLWSSDSNRVIRRSIFTWHDADIETPKGAVIVSIFLLEKSQ